VPKKEVSFCSFQNAAEMLEALEELIADAAAVGKVNGYEIQVTCSESADAMSLNEETLTDGSTVYNIELW
jgi:hypothetical protein